jgi:hypothetical protein
MVRGRIVNGVVRIGTAWIPPHPWGWAVQLPGVTRLWRRLVDSVFLPPFGHGSDNA